MLKTDLDLGALRATLISRFLRKSLRATAERCVLSYQVTWSLRPFRFVAELQ